MATDEYDHEDEGGEQPVAAQAGQLDLDAGEEHLPWLESDEDYETEGVDTGRIVGFALIGLLVIGLIVGGIWWITRDRIDPDQVADGSTIAAPAGPYKNRPAQPGGKTFEGTGDESFAVAEGQDRDGQLATQAAPRPSIDAATVANTSAQAEAAAASSAVGVQVGAYSSRAGAGEGWSRLVAQFSALRGVKYRVVEGRADIGTVYRLQALAPNVAAATSLCNQLKASGGACQVKP